MDDVAATFRDNDREDPRHDANRRTAPLLQRQTRGHKNADPSIKQQKALSPEFIEHLNSIAKTDKEIAMSQLATGAFFFAMRSCEYLSVSGERRTKLLQLQNIRFFKNNKELKHNDPHLGSADTVSITFYFQKNDQRDDTVTMWRTSDPTLCPVKTWAKIVKRIWSYPDATWESSVNLFLQKNGKSATISGSVMLRFFRKNANVMGKEKLGYDPADIGTHSIRSGCAMSMYLDNVPIYTIILVGRWSSDAFLRHIRKQVQEFSVGVSTRMIRNKAHHCTPDPSIISPEDPRMSGHLHNFSCRGNLAMGGPSSAARTPAVSLYA